MLIEICNLKVKLNHETRIVFHRLKNYNLRFILQELGKLDFKINVIPNGLEKYMNFDINNKLIVIGNFQFLSSLLHSLVKNFGKDDFKHLSQQFDSKVLNLAERI